MKKTLRNARNLLGVVLLVALSATRVSGETPVPEVGSAAPPLDLQAADGSRRSLDNIEGPKVLIFFRGLW